MQTQSQKSMTTKGGTTLPLINLKGKDYLQVMHRLVWFREEKPDWAIKTTIIERQAEFCLVRAEIYTGDGKLVSTGHKREDAKHFPDYLEKAETGAVGRALAMIGYGTQFAPELDEEDRIVDSPAPARPAPTAAGTAGARRPIGPPPTAGARQATAPARGTPGPTVQSTASPSKKSAGQEDFASFRGGPVQNN